MADTRKHEEHGIPGAAIAAGVLAAGTAAAAGYYFYGTKHAKQHRTQTVKWAHDMKKEVEKQTKKLPKMSEEAFHSVVDTVAATYKDNTDPEAVKHVAEELKKNWNKVRREIAPAAKKAKVTARKTVSKAKAGAKKAIKKGIKTAKRRA